MKQIHVNDYCSKQLILNTNIFFADLKIKRMFIMISSFFINSRSYFQEVNLDYHAQIYKGCGGCEHPPPSLKKFTFLQLILYNSQK